MAEHATFNEHDIDWENLKVQKGHRWYNRKVKEALLINCRKAVMNKDVGLELSVTWKSFFQLSFRRKEEKSGFFFRSKTEEIFGKGSSFRLLASRKKVFAHRIIN